MKNTNGFNYNVFTDTVSDEDVVEYLRVQFKNNEEYVQEQMERFKRNEDIYEEFKYSFFNLKNAYDGHDVYDDPLIYAVNEPVREQGYSTFDLFLNYETALTPLGIYNLLISLRENPKVTAMFIEGGLIKEPIPDISNQKKIKNKIK